MAFSFRFETVLKLRQHKREVEQQSAAIARIAHAHAIEDRDRLLATRSDVINELRCLNDDEAWDVAKVAQRRSYAEELRNKLNEAESAINETSIKLESAIQRLIASDQLAKGLEKLSDREHADFQRQQLKMDARDFEDCLNSRRETA